MKSKFIFTILFLFPVFISSAQITITRQKSFGGSNMDINPKILKINDNYIIAGSSNSGVSFDKTEPSRGDYDIWILKTDQQFNILWQRTIGGIGYETLSDIIITKDSSLLLTSWSTSDISYEKSENSYGHIDYWLLKLSLSGSIIWQKTIGGKGSDTPCCIWELPDSTIILAGSSDSDSSGLKSEDSRGTKDYWILRLDSQGNILWDRTYGGSGFDVINSITLMDDSLILISGRSNSPASYEKSQNSYGGNDIWIICINLYGDIIWDRTLGGHDHEVTPKTIFHDNYIYIAASSESDISGVKSENSRGGNDLWLIKLDKYGVIIWDKTIGGSENDYVNSFFLSTSEFLIISGISYSDISGEKTEALKGACDYWIVAIDTNSNIVWQKAFGGSSYDFPHNMVEISHGHYVVVGDSYSSISGDRTVFLKGVKDYWIIEFEGAIGVNALNPQLIEVGLFPNPATNYFSIKTDSHQNIRDISIYSYTGNILKKITGAQTYSTINISDLPQGIYIVEITLSNNQKIIKKLVKY